MDRLSRGELLLDLALTKAEDIIKGVKIAGSLGCSDHILVEFAILMNMGLTKIGVRALNFSLRNCWRQSPGKLSLQTKEWKKAGCSLRMPF